MADAGKPQSNPPDIPFHVLVKQFLEASDPPPDLLNLVGYFGPSQKEGNIRLYTGLDFQEYYEIPKTGILLYAPVDRHDELCPTRVFLTRETRLEHVAISRVSGEASFLEGGIASGITPEAVAAEARISVLNTQFVLRSNPPRKCHSRDGDDPGSVVYFSNPPRKCQALEYDKEVRMTFSSNPPRKCH